MNSVVRIVLTILCLVAGSAAVSAQERILQFVSDVAVQRNGDLLVTESIRVQAEGRDIRRGILRDFPTTYSRADGTRVEVGFDVQSVTRDGRPEMFTTERLRNGVRVRIGRADQTLIHGPHDYVITYRTTRQIGFFPSFDELYWNATGNGWTLTIDSAEARITLPEPVPFEQTALYTGLQGSRDRNARVVEERPGRIVFRTTRPLPPNNGLTVAASWQKGVVTPPTRTEQTRDWLWDNLPLVVSIAGGLLVLAYYWFAWMRVGRDPPRGVIIPLFGPPEGMSAAAVRYVKQMGFDQRTYTAALLDLAVHGRLKISENGKQTTLFLNKAGTEIGPPERSAEAALFLNTPSIVLTNAQHSRIGKSQSVLTERLEKAYGYLFNLNTEWAGLGLLLWIGVAALTLLATIYVYDVEEGIGRMFGLAFALPAVSALAILIRSGMQRRLSWWQMVLFGGVALVFGLVGLAQVVSMASRWVELLPVVIVVGLAPLVALGFSWLRAPSVKGRQILDQIEGFRDYLGVAEEERLEYLHPPEKTPELFERFLPYAVALDVENRWAARFAGVLAAAAAAGAATAAWYSGSGNLAGDPTGFTDRIGSNLATTIAAAATPPGSSDGGGGSSGSGGGGSSGGGGGGGGGSGW